MCDWGKARFKSLKWAKKEDTNNKKGDTNNKKGDTNNKKEDIKKLENSVVEAGHKPVHNTLRKQLHWNFVLRVITIKVSSKDIKIKHTKKYNRL